MSNIRRRCRKLPAGQPRNRRGAALVFSVALLFGLFGFLAFSIDTGFLGGAKAEMRRTADAAALAGCWEIYDQLNRGESLDSCLDLVGLQGSQMAAQNLICNASPYVNPSPNSADIAIGYLNSLSSGIITNNSSAPFFAVRVNVSRTLTKNGEIPFFFGRIYGENGRGMTTSATAVMARQITGFKTPDDSSQTLDILPFALDQQTWNALLDGLTSDNYSYDAETGAVTPGADGLLEVNLYPQGTGSPGNRGTVDIGPSNNSTKDIARQILQGISVSDLDALGKPLSLDSDIGLTLNGDTGISAGVKDELASIVGEKRIIPVFSTVSGNGNNATYTITKWVGVRILDVKLTGKMSGKKLVVQPAPIIARNGIISKTGGSYSDFVLSPAFLAQ